ncbi:uncharacterized protein DUF2834 [Sphingomonas faeni]|uniref:Uncharacterized protein DUF2834 n=1 Tax=Sphingomonas faeni TaxID=185950 RepID=A0A2T5U1L0_9SPHN|nr:DUF2834 domain-containing protein [Sphingomonas faeni]PTW45396.1 uncharacterized protein DUF2834 [Sphingomonas faeni]
MIRRPHRLSTAYFALAAVGLVLPYSRLIPWIGDHGLDIRALVVELFSTRIGAFFGLDVIVSAVVLIVFVIVQGRRDHVRYGWLAILATGLVGVSCGLPLFLALRERALQGHVA